MKAVAVLKLSGLCQTLDRSTSELPEQKEEALTAPKLRLPVPVLSAREGVITWTLEPKALCALSQPLTTFLSLIHKNQKGACVLPTNSRRVTPLLPTVTWKGQRLIEGSQCYSAVSVEIDLLSPISQILKSPRPVRSGHCPSWGESGGFRWLCCMVELCQGHPVLSLVTGERRLVKRSLGPVSSSQAVL